MAYHDLNGTIMIDELAALSDIQKAERAKQVLNSASVSLKRLIAEAENFQGETAQALVQKSLELNGRISTLVNNLEAAQDYTRRTVERYRQLDLQWKMILESKSK